MKRRTLWVMVLAVSCGIAGGFAYGAEAEVAVEAAAVAPAMEQVDLAADRDEPVFEDARSDLSFDLVLNAIPAALLIDMNRGKLEVNGATSSKVYLMPNIAGGLGMDVADTLYADFVVGAGVLVNESLRAFLLQGLLSLTYAVDDSFNVGPHVGLMQFMGADWIGAGNIDVDDATAWLLGLQFIMGDRVRYYVSVDYIAGSFGLTATDALTVIADDRDSVKMRALAVQFGVRGEF